MESVRKNELRDMLTDRHFMRRILKIALPIMLQQMITTAMYMVDTVMIGGLGDIPLAGVGAANQLAYLLDILLFALTSGGSVYMSQYFGRKDQTGFRRTLGLSAILCTGFAAAFVVVARLWGGFAVGLFSKEAAVVTSGVEYLNIACFGYIFKAAIYPYGAAHKSSGDAKLPMISGAVALGVNVFLNYCLIFGNLGFPALGLRGAAIATVIGSACDAATILTATYIKESMARARLKELLNQNWRFLCDFIKVSLPAFLDDALWAVGTMMITYVYGKMGTDTFAAVMIVNTMDRLISIALMGIGMAAAVVLGNILGAGDRDRALIYGRRFIYLSLIIGVATVILSCTLGPLLPNLYTKTSDAVRELASRTIFYMGLTSITYAVNFTMIIGILRSGGDTRAAAWIDLIPLFLIAVPVTALCGLYFKLPLDIVFLCTIPNNILRFVLALARVRSDRWARTLV